MTTPTAPVESALRPCAPAIDDLITAASAERASCPVPRVVSALRRHTPLAAELDAAIEPDGRVDRVPWGLAVLGAAVFAVRVACRAPDVRRVVARFVEAALAPTCALPVRTYLVERAVAVVDALYLALGEAGLRDDNPRLRLEAEAILADEALW